MPPPPPSGSAAAITTRPATGRRSSARSMPWCRANPPKPRASRCDNRRSIPTTRRRDAPPPMTDDRPWHILTGEYPPQRGGVADYTALVAAGLAARGIPAHVWAPPAESTGPEPPGVTVHREAGSWSPADLRRLGERLDASPGPRRILVQYTPNAWGYKGPEPRLLPLAARQAPRRRRGADDDPRGRLPVPTARQADPPRARRRPPADAAHGRARATGSTSRWRRSARTWPSTAPATPGRRAGCRCRATCPKSTTRPPWPPCGPAWRRAARRSSAASGRSRGAPTGPCGTCCRASSPGGTTASAS